uniref:Coiled-coil domain containing 77 n=1 Tax=Podarcis muralis TaxID=64176 RepID=A0A670JP63_PODMU
MLTFLHTLGFRPKVLEICRFCRQELEASLRGVCRASHSRLSVPSSSGLLKKKPEKTSELRLRRLVACPPRPPALGFWGSLCLCVAPKELEDRKKIQHLLALLGTDSGEVTYFCKEPPHKVRAPLLTYKTFLFQVLSKLFYVASGEKPENEDRYNKDEQTLLLQVEALQAQLEEQAKLSKEQTEALLEDRRIRIEESLVQHQRDQEKIKELTQNYHKVQNLLHESTRDFLQMKFDARANEKSWMAEKDMLLRKLDKRKGAPKWSRIRQGVYIYICVCVSQSQRLQERLTQEQRLSNMFREQCVSLEEQLAKIREEGDVGREIFKERSEKMGKRLQLMTQRYEALEKRRCMEVEGFKTDIKQLRQSLKEVERLLFKVTATAGPEQDLAILQEVRQGNRRTKKIQGELKNLKSKIYGLENELRAC